MLVNASKLHHGNRIGLILSAIFAVLIVGGGFAWVHQQLGAPGTSRKPVRVTIASGESLQQVATELGKLRLVNNTDVFLAYAKQAGLAPRLRAGTYFLDKAMSAQQVVSVLEAAPAVIQNAITLPDGLTDHQMAAIIGSSHAVSISSSSYLAALQQNYPFSFLGWRPAGNTSMEGFMFPDTFDLPAHATARQIATLQLSDFAHRAVPLLSHPPTGYTPYQALIVASIVEKEAKNVGDYPLVAGVIYNRLRIGMDLQLNTTVLYGLGLTGGNLSNAQLARNTPYNTYLNAGLPPTPISNPGVAAITAAVRPAATSYLYFVSDSCGNLHYSVTAQQHNLQVQKYMYTSACSPGPAGSSTT